MSTKEDLVSEEIQDTASIWLSRRDRGLGASEQDAYLEWLYQNPLHGRAIVQLERVWASLNRLSEWRPAHSAVPNPDLLAPRRHSRLYWLSTALVAAAAIGMAFYVWLPSRAATPRHEAIIHPGPERLVLEDGSIVELNTGAKVDVHFTPGERRVRLVQGEAHFTVAKNPNRPFIVGADKVAVRAVGTAFSVTLGQQDVTVLVTEGKVQVMEQPTAAPNAQLPTSNVQTPTYLITGQQAVISLTADVPVAPTVQDVSPAQIERSLAWQGIRLEFVDMPLGDVVAEFNRYNRQKLVISDSETAAMLVGGNFRADNVDTFVRLLDASFGVKAIPHGDEIVLRKVQ